MRHEYKYVHDFEKIHAHKHPILKQGIIASTLVGFIHGLVGIAYFLLFLTVICFATKLDS